MKGLYLLINLFTVIVPFIFSFHPRIQFLKNGKSFIKANLLVALAFIVWDIIFTRSGVWSFNPRYILGIYIIDLPIEEILFFICIPYACVFTYFCLDKFYKLDWNKNQEAIFCIVFSFALLGTGLVFYEQLYTSVTLISTALVCLVLKFVAKVSWFGKAVLVYSILLVPFLMVNGILTGTGLEEPVVRYNDMENMGIRILTIPIEDVFYGLELFLLNIFLFEWFRKGQ